MTKLPFVIETNDKDGERAYDLYSRMLKDRIVFVTGEFHQDMADAVVAQLLFLEADDPVKDIYMYIKLKWLVVIICIWKKVALLLLFLDSIDE